MDKKAAINYPRKSDKILSRWKVDKISKKSKLTQGPSDSFFFIQKRLCLTPQFIFYFLWFTFNRQGRSKVENYPQTIFFSNYPFLTFFNFYYPKKYDLETP